MFRTVKSLLSLLLVLVLFGCQESSITEIQPEEAVQRIASEATSEIFLSKGNTGKVSVCHFPQGNNGNAQILSVSGSALDAHLAHEGDGIVGVDYDSNCEPLPPPGCPCWANGELDNFTWNTLRETSGAVGLVSNEAIGGFPFGMRANVYLYTNTCDLGATVIGQLSSDQMAICEADLRNTVLVEPEEDEEE